MKITDEQIDDFVGWFLLDAPIEPEKQIHVFCLVNYIAREVDDDFEQSDRKIIEDWLSNTRIRTDADLRTQGNLEFLSKNYQGAAQMYERSARAFESVLYDLERSESPSLEELTKIKFRICGSLMRAAKSFQVLQDFQNELALLEEAAMYTAANENPRHSARLQRCLAVAAVNHANTKGFRERASFLGKAVSFYKTALALLTVDRHLLSRRVLQLKLGLSMLELAGAVISEKRKQILLEAIDTLQIYVEHPSSKQDLGGWCCAKHNLGVAFWDLATLTNGGDGRLLLDQATASFREVIDLKANKTVNFDQSASARRLAEILASKRDAGSKKAAIDSLTIAVEFLTSRADLLSKDKDPQEWARTLHLLASSLLEMARNAEWPDRSKLLQRAREACLRALEIRTKEKSLVRWFMTTSLYGEILLAEARLNRKETKIRESGLDVFRGISSNEIRNALPEKWAWAKSKLADNLSSYSFRPSGEALKSQLKEAVDARRASLEIYTPDSYPKEYVATQLTLASTLEDIGSISPKEKAIQLLKESLAARHSAISLIDPVVELSRWGHANNFIGHTLQNLGMKTGGRKGLEFMSEAILTYKRTMTLCTKEKSLSEFNVANQSIFNIEDYLESNRENFEKSLDTD